MSLDVAGSFRLEPALVEKPEIAGPVDKSILPRAEIRACARAPLE